MGARGQTQVVGLVLVTVIILTTLSATLWWAGPVLEKSKTNSRLYAAISSMQSLEKAINDVAANGGSRVVYLTINGRLEVSGAVWNGSNLEYVYEENWISYDVPIGNIPPLTSTWTALDGSPAFAINQTTGEPYYLPGSADSDKPGVIMARVQRLGEGYEAQFRLAYRELVDPNTGDATLVQLVRSGNAIAVSQEDQPLTLRVVVTARDPIYNPNGLCPSTGCGHSLVVIPVEVRLEGV